ncbi:HIT family protein [Myceligenerans salitolerans]|uniref:HIT domain-containing protein n=1 Tax=Myceligenerans salitolerans TaxID=1230528 RepID=A0ABS3IC86_9MICO|nr:HIT domain-containing protein [Myceligenerans salitolerans]MBO0610608.1 HIT domain-containing protein [Myceligenerans salitolerans]
MDVTADDGEVWGAETSTGSFGAPSPAGQEDAVVIEEPGAFAPPEDHYQRLWNPHRLVYIGGEGKPSDGSERRCPFCRIPRGDDEQGLVVARGELCYVVLNLYPYNSGHLMVLPYRHVSDYTDLDEAETLELAAMTQAAMRTTRAAYAPAGFNLGINQGEVAGAGIAAHLHQHVVPRWPGDSNFLPVVAQTKSLPELLSDTRRRLADAWPGTGATAASRHT